jgi:hypothetical protein
MARRAPSFEALLRRSKRQPTVVFFLLIIFVGNLIHSFARSFLRTSGHLCTTPYMQSHFIKIWVLMHAWDEPKLLREAMHSVFQQKRQDLHVGKIHVELVVFVDRCGAQLDYLTRRTCHNLADCTLLERGDVKTCPSLGSAAAKVALLSHINAIIEPNDYFTFLDGDDTYATTETLINIYRSVLLPKRPYFAWGAHSGRFSEQCRDILDTERRENHAGRRNVRQLSWSFCHPRFFRGSLLQHLNELDFKRDDGNWLQKATDRPLIYAAMELGGLSNSINPKP